MTITKRRAEQLISELNPEAPNYIERRERILDMVEPHGKAPGDPLAKNLPYSLDFLRLGASRRRRK